MINILIAVEIDAWDVENEVEVTIGLCNKGSLTAVEYIRGFEPNLITPVQIGSGILGGGYGEPIRAEPNLGKIEFELDEITWPWLDYSYFGREIRIYKGEMGDRFGDLELVFKGKTTGDVDHDELKAGFTITDNGFNLNKPLINELYENTGLTIDGLPKPRLYGRGFNIEPILIDDIGLIYQISDRKLYGILEIRVGGIPWEKKNYASEPGQWQDLFNGTFSLGGVVLGGEVRCDALAEGWDELTSGKLFQEIIEDFGGEVDELKIEELNTIAPYLVGKWIGVENINIQDFIDEIANSIGGWWGYGNSGKAMLVVFKTKAEIDFELNDSDISDLNVAELIAPVYRFRFEYYRNNSPNNQLYDAVSEEKKDLFKRPGTITGFTDLNILHSEPMAIDVPVVRSLIMTDSDMQGVVDRLSDIWTFRQIIYNIIVPDLRFKLYDKILINYEMIKNKEFRIYSIVRFLGQDLVQLQIQG